MGGQRRPGVDWSALLRGVSRREGMLRSGKGDRDRQGLFRGRRVDYPGQWALLSPASAAAADVSLTIGGGAGGKVGWRWRWWVKF